MKRFEEMNQIEKLIHNTEYTIKSCNDAINILKANNGDYTPQIVLLNEIAKNEKWLIELKQDLANGKTEV